MGTIHSRYLTTLMVPLTLDPCSHWLYRTQQRLDFKLREPTARLSKFIPSDENRNPATGNTQTLTLRRVLSASSVDPLSSPSIENHLLPIRPDASVGRLSTLSALISPRPLGPTHILVIYTKTTASPPSSRKWHTFPETIQIPINDLLFVLNVPNLTNPGNFPHKLPSELPRILMQVKHLETFPELVVYLHTKNQAELFRRLLPEWIRDLMHPLPLNARVTRQVSKPDVGAAVKSHGCGPRINLHLSKKKSQVLPSPAGSDHSDRAIESIAKEIVEAEVSLPSFGVHVDPLVNAITTLNALKDNLELVGFFEQKVWAELELSRDILVKALSRRAKLVEADDA
jgi:hypothetical protein